jgi:hypothetical protein
MSANTTTTGRAAQAAVRGQEALMGQAVPSQHPAVVLRSRFNQLRALLAVALIAVIGLTVAVVILASRDQQASGPSPAAAIGPGVNYGEFNPATGRPDSLALSRAQTQPSDSATRPDRGPEESAVAAAVGTQPSAVGPDESDIAAAIGSANGARAITGSRSDSLAQEEHPLRSRVGTPRYGSGPGQGSHGPKDYGKNSATGDYARP